MGVSTYGELLHDKGTVNVDSLTPEERDNYLKLQNGDKAKLLKENNQETQYVVSPMIRKGQQTNIGGIRGTFQQVM